MNHQNLYNKKKKINKSLFCLLGIFLLICNLSFAEEKKSPTSSQPVEVNGDTVEFFTDSQKIQASGNIVINYGDTVLTCDKITVFTSTKDAIAEGNVKLTNPQGVLTSNSLVYNFDLKEGRLVDVNFKSEPYFGLATEVEKKATKFILKNGYITTCNFDKPHYRIYGREIEVIPNDKIVAKNIVFFLGNVPVLYAPFFRQSLKDKRHFFNFIPGHSKEWGTFTLMEFRYWLIDDKVRSVLHYDWRENKGFGGGIDIQHDFFGSGKFNYYQVNEHLRGRGEVEPFWKDNTRYKIEYRHKWDINNNTDLLIDLHRFSDTNFLKNYFYRQYEKDSAPSSYILWTHAFANATLSAELRKRINQFYSETEKLPELKFQMPNFEIAQSNIYLMSESSITSFNSKTANSDTDIDTVRFDTFNKFSYPLKFLFMELNPFIGERISYYSKDKEGNENLLRNIFYSGLDISTKFYRIYDVYIDSWGISIDRLRHIIMPLIEFDYIHQPTLSSSRLNTFDSVDSISVSNTVKLSLINKLQTKRDSETIDFLSFIVDSTYNFKTENLGGGFSDINFDLELLPNSRLKFYSDAKYDLNEHYFKNANFDIKFNFGENDRYSLGAGYRYSRDSDSQLLNFSFENRINSKWKFRCFQRYNLATNIMEEQEYAIVRDLHCWEFELSVNNRDQKGIMFWWIFRLKAFPSVGFEVENSYQQPKSH